MLPEGIRSATRGPRTPHPRAPHTTFLLTPPAQFGYARHAAEWYNENDAVYGARNSVYGGVGRPMFEIFSPFPGRLFASAMPFGPHDLDHSLWEHYQAEGVTHVVMLVSDAESRATAQRDLRALYQQHGLTVWQHPIPDFAVPHDLAAFRAMLRQVTDALQNPAHTIVVHCAAGRGRTGLFLACWAQEALGKTPTAALQWVRRYIPGAVETRAQEEFVLTWPLRALPLKP